MTNKNRALGNGLEARVVQRAKKRGVPAVRQPGSGVYREYPNDVVLGSHLGAFLVECKVRTDHPTMKEMLGWLEYVKSNAHRIGYPGAVVVYNQKGARQPKVMLDLDLFLELLQSEKSALDKEKSA